MGKTIIGITSDFEINGSHSKWPHYALREHYIKIMSDLDALPIIIPYDFAKINEYSQLIDGFLIPGGDDIDPKFYGDSDVHSSVKIKPYRSEFELELAQACYKKGKPLLGICGGMQLINILFKGNLFQHIPDEVTTCLEHKQPVISTNTWHIVKISKHTKLHDIIACDEIHVNSDHHQSVKIPGAGCVINAMAEDGIIEGIELKDYPFAIGVQWHPEITRLPEEERLFASFVKYCKR